MTYPQAFGVTNTQILGDYEYNGSVGFRMNDGSKLIEHHKLQAKKNTASFFIFASLVREAKVKRVPLCFSALSLDNNYTVW